MFYKMRILCGKFFRRQSGRTGEVVEDGLNSRGDRFREFYEAEQVYDLSFIGAAC